MSSSAKRLNAAATHADGGITTVTRPCSGSCTASRAEGLNNAVASPRRSARLRATGSVAGFD
jgi:hypothetical protein